MQSNRISCQQLALVIACLIFVYFMAVNGLKGVPLANHDELRTLTHIFGGSISTPQSLQATVANVAQHSEQHGPLYFILLNVWATFTGGSLLFLRLLSTFFALLSLAATYRLAWLTRERHLALAAVFILTINWLFLFYARELRMYTLLPCLVAWIVWSYWRLIETFGRISWRTWLSSCHQLWAHSVPALFRYLHSGGCRRVSPLVCAQEQTVDSSDRSPNRGRDALLTMATDRI